MELRVKENPPYAANRLSAVAAIQYFAAKLFDVPDDRGD